MIHPFVFPFCAVCGLNYTDGYHTMCRECINTWKRTDRSRCPACKGPKRGESSALCFSCESAYRAAKNHIPPIGFGSFKAFYCARCKTNRITRKRCDLCDVCYRGWFHRNLLICAACERAPVLPCLSHPHKHRDLCFSCFCEWKKVQPTNPLLWSTAPSPLCLHRCSDRDSTSESSMAFSAPLPRSADYSRSDVNPCMGSSLPFTFMFYSPSSTSPSHPSGSLSPPASEDSNPLSGNPFSAPRIPQESFSATSTHPRRL